LILEAVRQAEIIFDYELSVLVEEKGIVAPDEAIDLKKDLLLAALTDAVDQSSITDKKGLLVAFSNLLDQAGAQLLPNNIVLGKVDVIGEETGDTNLVDSEGAESNVFTDIFSEPSIDEFYNNILALAQAGEDSGYLFFSLIPVIGKLLGGPEQRLSSLTPDALQSLREKHLQVLMAFLENHPDFSVDKDILASLQDEKAIEEYSNKVVEEIKNSSLRPEVKKEIIKIWKNYVKEYTNQLRQILAEEDAANQLIPVYDKKGKLIGYWPLDVEAAQHIKALHDNQSIYIQLTDKGNLADLRLQTTNEDNTGWNNTIIRSDIEIDPQALIPTKFGWKKVIEGILLVNNKLFPLYGIYLLAGLGNVSSMVSNYAQTPFGLTDSTMFMMSAISSLSMGFMSFVAGILQNRWSRMEDGTINGARGRNRTMAVGIISFVLGMVIPMLFGMHGQLGDATAAKEYALFASFIILGIAAAFMDVSMKPIVLAATRKSDYQAKQGFLSVFKQTVGNAGNYILPPVAAALASLFGTSWDWTIYFPVYGVLGVTSFLIYFLSDMHQQTLELSPTAEKKPLSVGSTLKEVVGNEPYKRIIRQGVLATTLHGINMAALGTYVNQLFRLKIGGSFDAFAQQTENAGSVLQNIWNSLSHSWSGWSLLFYTLPIILGRYFGTKLIKRN